MKLVGYTDRLSVARGDEITFMVSSQHPAYRADIVRLIHGDPNAAGPGFKSDPVASTVSGTYAGTVHPISPGSYAWIPDRATLRLGPEFTVQMWIMPTAPTAGTQTLVAKGNDPANSVALRIVGGHLELSIGDCTVRSERLLDRGIWYSVAVSASARTGTAILRTRQKSGIVLQPAERLQAPLAPLPGGIAGDLTLAAEYGESTAELINFYNGKIDSPRLYDRSLSNGELAALQDRRDHLDIKPIAHWDFSQDISSNTITDVSGNDAHGAVVNKPTRAVTGHNWDTTCTSWVERPDQYGAIHFHDDDLADAEWPTAFRWTIPDDLPSGVYAAHLTQGDDEDFLWFAVVPHLDAPTADTVLVLPTFSYLAYANEQMAHEGTLKGQVASYPCQQQDHYIIDNHLLSLYDKHSDGSSVCYASWLRPLANMRPKYNQQWLDHGNGSPHQLPADLYLVDWLVEHGYAFDVITDLELHHDGAARLASYKAVLTGTHAEYTSAAMLDAYRDYLDDGGRVLYLSGNGMYWVAEFDADPGTGIEIRRRTTPVWNWPAAAGEAHLSSTGELGTIWHLRGRNAQSWLGVGMSGEGNGPGRPYRRTAHSHDPRVAFVFDGIADDELIGDTPCLVNGWGAAGYEVDWWNPRLAPSHALRVATADDFGPDFEVTAAIMDGGAAQHPRMQSDLVFVEYPNDGAVFSFSSISWAACLSYNGYDNAVSRLTRNVLDGFLADKAPWLTDQ